VTLPIAAFLAGSILTLLLPLTVLIGLGVWYTKVFRRLPAPAESSGTEAPAPPGTEGDKPHDA
jgi:hypothetical protein